MTTSVATFPHQIFIDVYTLVFDEANYNTHSRAQIEALVADLREFGQRKPIVIRHKDGAPMVVAGEGTTLAFRQLAQENLRQWGLIWATVVPEDWDDEKARGYMVADNETARAAVSNTTSLLKLVNSSRYSYTTLGFTQQTYQALLDATKKPDAIPAVGAGGDDFSVEDVQTRSKVGDIWQVGRHRIGCIDSKDERQVQRLLQGITPHLIFADPPYGVSEQTNRKEKGRGALTGSYDFPAVLGDDMPFDPLPLLRMNAQVRVMWGANYFANKLPSTSSWITWDKRDGMTSNDNADCEMAWTDVGGPARVFVHRWNGMIKASEQKERRVHPTQKPVALAEWTYAKYAQDCTIVYDPYMGSGISLIAAERTGRTCYGCELIPQYVDVVLARWEKETGGTATLVEHIDAEPVAGGDDFDVTPVEGEPHTHTGEFWKLGEHMLLVGDSTKRDDVAKLLQGNKVAMCFTSPPYNAAMKSNGELGNLPNKDKYVEAVDQRSESAYLQFLTQFTTIALEWCAYVYVNIQSLSGNKMVLIDYLYQMKKKYADTIIWDKCAAEPAMAMNVLNSQFEYVHVFSERAIRVIGTKEFRGTLTNILHLPSRQDKQHSSVLKATFPLAFASHFINEFTRFGETVYEPFAGTGTTLIACHRLGRKCMAIEVEPKYADIVLSRWEADTGQKAELLYATV